MSLIQQRSSWMRLCQNIDVPAEERSLVVVGATFTADPIAPYLGMRLTNDDAAPPVISMAPYNQLFQLCLNWQSMFPEKTPDTIVLIWRIEDQFRRDLHKFLRDQDPQELLDKVDELAGAVQMLRQSFPGTIICSTPPFPAQPDTDIRSMRNATGIGALHRKVVDLWCSRMQELENVSMIDLDGLQRHVGLEKSVDWRKFYLYKQPYTEAFWDLVGDATAKAILSKSKASKKCVVVDCDNTLWGGIIGEDGLSGIALGDDYPGSVFRDFQHQLLNLRSQGVMIALCSKNNEEDVWEVFDKHDGMILKKDDVVAARINWVDKPSNIASIAKELNIGLDSFVFVDDNPMEIEHVRAALPEVTCILVPEELTFYPVTFGSYQGFDRERVSSEDRARSDMMLQERKRRELATAVTPEDFRRELKLKIDLFDVQPEHIARVSQLINKSNQFNLTTRRKSESEVLALTKREDARVLAWRVSDRFGDYGLVGVAILELKDEIAEIETFLMSCRVLGRKVEHSIFAAICDLVAKENRKELRGSYLRTQKNKLVENLYKDYGFKQLSEEDYVLNDLDSIAWPEEIDRLGL